MDKAGVDLGKSESTAGLMFVCLSRAKRVVDILIQPMPFERRFKLGDKPTFQLRLREEVRLRALAGETLTSAGCSVMSVHIYVSLVRRRVETSTPHYTNTCVKLTIVICLSFSERLAIANLSFTLINNFLHIKYVSVHGERVEIILPYYQPSDKVQIDDGEHKV